MKISTQLADGTWHVRTRSHPFQPPMDSGFPHGRDGWISGAGTSWAVMSLASTLDPSATPPPALAATAIVVPGQPDASPLLSFVQDQVEDMEMPPLEKRAKIPAWTKDEVRKLGGWIAQGALWPQDAILHVPE